MRKVIGILLMAIGMVFVSVAGCKLWLHHTGQVHAIHKAEASVKGADSPGKQLAAQKTFHPDKGQVIGLLKIPEINLQQPIIEGSSQEVLAKGVGHYRGTAFPGQHDQIVLSGHRDTVFRRLGELKSGDKIILQLPYGTFDYVMKDSKIVSADDRTVIHATAPKEVLTMSTCYPFHYIGNAPKRYVISAYLEKTE
ncbi:sortase A [Scopulibacillus darangshiensis]|uniref:Sortase A n=1 Tax=Scopulibacillus darangshiensis TaxID=442528 RepID=A0A4R2NEP7_9BACL|nr:class D sortase [Scopulibacillus darangshiensis]TCP19534.1 sortase A [Scopulibacillus darangshiensis]